MRALILAAGIASRIAKQVNNQQKCTLPLADGTPLLRYTVALLTSYNIEVSIVTGYQGDLVKKCLQGLPVKFFHNPFFKDTGSLASYYFARSSIDPSNNYLHLEADTFIEPALLELILAHRSSEPIMFADFSRQQQADIKVKCVNGYLKLYSKEIPPPFDGEACDIYLIPAKQVQRIASLIETEVLKGNYHGWWSDVLTLNCQQQPLKVEDVGGLFWQEIDYYSDYQKIIAYSQQHQQQLQSWLSGVVS